jgi:hypothetical protein
MFKKKNTNSTPKKRVLPQKWKVISGTDCDDTRLSNGEKELSWDEWFRMYYK